VPVSPKSLLALTRRLAETSPAEVGHRAWSGVQRVVDEGWFALGRSGRPVRATDGSVTFETPWLESASIDEAAQRLRFCRSDYADDIVTRADAICRGTLTLLGTRVDYGQRVRWQADPMSGRDWPHVFHARIDIFGGAARYGDVKYVWELNRHQFLPTLGKAYRLTRDPRYVAAGVQMIDHWIEDNPYQLGINWASALEVAIRALAWVQACGLFEGATSFDGRRRQKILASLEDHRRYLSRHLSTYFSPYNHLVGEAAALSVLGTALPALSGAAGWRESAWRMLVRETTRQFHPDGGSVEQATGYHHFTLGFYLQAALARRRVGLPIDGPIWTALERASEYSMYLTRPDGQMPAIGDGDEGRAFDLEQASLWDFRVFLALAATLYGRGDFKRIAGVFPSDLAWVIGRKGWDEYDSLPTCPPTSTSKSLESSGYYILRSGWENDAQYLCFDCGEISAGVRHADVPSAAHGHADALAIEVSVSGRPALVDPGFYTYNGSAEWHRYFRDTAAHNTVVVDGESQATYRGRLRWSQGYRATPHHWVTTACMDYAEGSHDGYTRLASPVQHRRGVLFMKPDYWLLRDELTGEGEHQIDRYFHLAPDFDPTVLGSRVSARDRDGVGLLIIALEDDALTTHVWTDGDAPEDGWVATGYGQRRRAPAFSFRTRITGPTVLHTLLVPFRGTPPRLEVTPLVDAGFGRTLNRGFVIRIGSVHDRVIFNGCDQGVVTTPSLETDARVALIRRDGSDRIVSCAMVDGSQLACEDQVLLQAIRRVQFAASTQREHDDVIECSDPADTVISRSVRLPVPVGV
jgi:Heparinase II/III-like protein/Heparinase II/III N-terminus